MNTGRNKRCARLVVLIALASFFSDEMRAQVFTTLYSFYGSEGAEPMSTLLVSSNLIYGTTLSGGPAGNGVVFSMHTNGTGYQILHAFTGGTDGAQPRAGLLLSGSTLYGTASYGGSFGEGILFSLGIDGTRYTVLHAFTAEIWNYPGLPTNTDGYHPFGPLILWSNTLYGTAVWGGSAGEGTVFALNPDGSGFRTLHSFVQATDSEGPDGALIPFEGKLYGAAGGLGLSPSGAVFSINPDGTGFTVLHHFPGIDTRLFGLGMTNEVLSGVTNKILYGVTDSIPEGGPFTGSVFKLGLNGSFTNLHTFSLPPSSLTNYDGNLPARGSLASGSKILYGANTSAGICTNGTVYSIKPDGTAFAVLYTFTGGNDGAFPNAVTLSGNTLYGTTYRGGKYGNGTIFKIALIPIPLPVITSQPSSRTNIAGTTASFSIAATGQAPLSYQWLKSTNLLPQQVSSTLILTNLSDADAGTYSVIVSNGGGSVVSAAAYLAVLDPPAISTQPSSRTNIAGTTASFSVAAMGTGPLSFQWLRGSSPLPQQTSSSLTLLKVSDVDATSYSVVITNVAGSVTSTPAKLIIIDLPQLSAQRVGANALVFWPTGLTGFTLQWTANLTAPVWETSSNAPVIVNGQNTLTIPFSGTQQYFRLGK